MLKGLPKKIGVSYGRCDRTGGSFVWLVLSKQILKPFVCLRSKGCNVNVYVGIVGQR